MKQPPKLGKALILSCRLSICTVHSLTFDHAVLNNVDLRDVDIERISGVESMSETVISSLQAADLSGAFARHLEITVND